MKDDPNKNMDEIIVTSEGDFKRKTLAWLSWIKRNNQEIEDVLNDAARNHLSTLGKDKASEEEIENATNSFFCLSRLFKYLRKK